MLTYVCFKMMMRWFFFEILSKIHWAEAVKLAQTKYMQMLRNMECLQNSSIHLHMTSYIQHAIGLSQQNT